MWHSSYLATHLINIPHYKHAAIDFLQAEIEKLTSHPFQKSQKCSKQLSERMGVITHYLSDFCYAHSEHFQGDMTSHLFYESLLWYDFQRHQKAVRHNRITPDEIHSSTENIMSYVEEGLCRGWPLCCLDERAGLFL
ncbi:MAG: zinc dependent phospholipase C family protein [Desulfitobacteriaceae bacterium]